jgi:hypothetical protein
MPTLKNWIEGEANGEPIVAIVIVEMGWVGYNEPKEGPLPEKLRGTVLSWEEAVPFLQYEFSADYGAPGCQAITVWTASKVIFISQYDGSTSIHSVPRNPVAHMPIMPGG